jgi:hypothetical protein
LVLLRPEDEVGRTVDTIDQAKAVQTVSRLLYNLEVEFSASAQQYMASPSWNGVVAWAKEALSKLDTSKNLADAANVGTGGVLGH